MGLFITDSSDPSSQPFMRTLRGAPWHNEKSIRKSSWVPSQTAFKLKQPGPTLQYHQNHLARSCEALSSWRWRWCSCHLNLRVVAVFVCSRRSNPASVQVSSSFHLSQQRLAPQSWKVASRIFSSTCVGIWPSWTKNERKEKNYGSFAVASCVVPVLQSLEPLDLQAEECYPYQAMHRVDDAATGAGIHSWSTPS